MEIIETLIVPITTGLVEVIKKLDPNKKLERFYPIASLMVACGLSFAFNYQGTQTWFLSMMMGLIYGLSASGLYSGTSAVLELKKK